MGDLMSNKFSLVRPPPKASSEAFLLFKATLKVLMYGVKVKFLIMIEKEKEKKPRNVYYTKVDRIPKYKKKMFYKKLSGRKGEMSENKTIV